MSERLFGRLDSVAYAVSVLALIGNLIGLLVGVAALLFGVAVVTISFVPLVIIPMVDLIVTGHLLVPDKWMTVFLALVVGTLIITGAIFLVRPCYRGVRDWWA